MAERRMFAKTIIDSDIFLDMPQTTQNLYFHLNMRADDEGFVNSPKKIMRMVGSNQNDLEILLAKRYLIAFESGVIVIKHFKLHNTIRKDRMKETLYLEEKSKLREKVNGSYTEVQPDDNQMSTKCTPSVLDCSIVKSSIDEINTAEPKSKKPTKEIKNKHGEYGRVFLTEKQFDKLVVDYGESKAKGMIENIDTYFQEHQSKIKNFSDHNLTMRKWAGAPAEKQKDGEKEDLIWN